MAKAIVLSAVRTPVGRYGGGLAGVRPDDLAAVAIGGAVERAGVEPAEIEDVYLGCANQAGEDNRNVARMAALLAGLPESVAGVTVNRLCASGLSAVVSACHAVAAGDGELFVAGGVESMSRAPLVMAKPERAFPRGDQVVYDSTLGWRFPNPRMEERFPLESMGETGENVAERWGVSRDDQDAFALESQRRWAAAAEAGRFDDELVSVDGLDRDEHPRPDTSEEKLAARRVRRQRRRGRRPARDGHRARAGRAQAAHPRRRGRVRDRPGRAERGLRVAVARRPARARDRSRARERERRRHRDRPSARDERRKARRHAAARAAAPRRPLRARDALRGRRPGPGGAVRARDVAPVADAPTLRGERVALRPIEAGD